MNKTMKINSKESPSPITFCTVRISLQRLFAIEGKTPPEAADRTEFGMWLAHRYGYLPTPTSLNIQGDELLIEYPSEPEGAMAKAAELSQRAEKQHDRGDYEAAACLWRRALEKQPSSCRALRGLAEAYVCLGNFEKAKPLFLCAVWRDPDDAEALAALSAVYTAEKDFGRGEHFARLALALEPGDVTTLSNLATVYGETGRSEQSVAVIRQAIAMEPEHPGLRYLLAWQLRSQGKLEESVAAIERTFACAKLQDKGFARLRDSAWKLFCACQRELLEQNSFMDSSSRR
jgi:tetratricopeptide (TPR) repeat protein